MYRNVLAAVDASRAAPLVTAHAVAIAQAFHSRLTLVTVVPSLPGFAYSAPIDADALEQEAVRSSERVLRDALELVPPDLPVRTIVRPGGHAGLQIVDCAEQGLHDLIVVGSRHRGRVASGLLGSVAADVHFNTRIPLLIVPARDAEAEPPAEPPSPR
jgi:nucleotide-binding universal stress UspA family protein